MTVMNARRPLIRSTAAAAALGLGTVTLAACGSGSTSSDGKVNVVASFYPMEFLAEEIGGKHVSVSGLTKPGVEPHDLELSPQQTGELSDADLVVYLKGLQPAVDEGIEQAGAEHTAEASSYASPKKSQADEGDEGDEHSEHGDHGDHGEHGEGDHAEEGDEGGGHEGHDHDHGDAGDPHVWLDPLRYAQIAKGVGKELAKADPDHESQYRKNTAALVERLEKLDKELKEGLRDRETDTFVTTHAAFSYFAERYGLHEEAVNGVDPESEPSAARMKQLHQVAKEDKVNTVFFESNASDKTAKTLADDLGLKTSVLSPLESVKEPDKSDYFSLMRQNLKALQPALGAG